MNITLEQVREWTILEGYRGSIAHGTNLSKNDPNFIEDKDTMGIAIPPIEVYFGLQKFEQKEVFDDPWDIIIYEIKKFFNLLLKSNPNVLSLLYLEPNFYIKKTELGQRIIDNRDIFVSKQAYQSFMGYAISQIKKIERCQYAGYMGARRKMMVEKYGFDTKHSSTCLMLLNMGIEYLTEGRLYVQRKEAPILMEIKQGKWTLEQVKNESDRLMKLCEQAYINSKLPNEPNKIAAEKLLVEILNERFKK